MLTFAFFSAGNYFMRVMKVYKNDIANLRRGGRHRNRYLLVVFQYTITPFFRLHGLYCTEHEIIKFWRVANINVLCADFDLKSNRLLTLPKN